MRAFNLKVEYKHFDNKQKKYIPRHREVNGGCLMTIKEQTVSKFTLDLGLNDNKVKNQLEANYTLIITFMAEFQLNDIKFNWDKEKNTYIFETDYYKKENQNNDVTNYNLYSCLIICRYLFTKDPRYTRLYYNIQKYFALNFSPFQSYILASNEDKKHGDHYYYSFTAPDKQINCTLYTDLKSNNLHTNLFRNNTYRLPINNVMISLDYPNKKNILFLNSEETINILKKPYFTPLIFINNGYNQKPDRTITKLKDQIYLEVGKQLTLKGTLKKKTYLTPDKLTLISIYFEESKKTLILKSVNARKSYDKK